MMRFSSKSLPRRLCLLALLVSGLLLMTCAVQADLELNALYVELRADASIGAFDGSDQFEITYQSKDTGETDILTVDASAAVAGCSFELPLGSYSVTRIAYLGQKESVVSGGYAVDRSFQIGEDWDSLGYLIIYVGEDTLSSLDSYAAKRLIRDEAHAAKSPAEESENQSSGGTADMEYEERMALEALGIDPDATGETPFVGNGESQASQQPSTGESEAPDFTGTAVVIAVAAAVVAVCLVFCLTRRKKGGTEPPQ